MADDEYPLYERAEPALSAFEKNLYDEVAIEEPWELVEAFSMLHRHPGSDDEREAATYIEERFEAYDVPYERYEPEFWIAEPESVTLRILTPETREFTDDGRPSVKAHSFSKNGTIEGELVRLPVHDVDNVNELRGVSLSDLESEDANYEGNIVVVDQPIQSRRLVEQLEARGAVGYVIVHPHRDEPHSAPGTSIWGAIPEPDERHLLPDIHLINVSRTVGDYLFELLDGDESVTVRIETDVPRRWVRSPLIVARIPAETETSEFVLLHGHYDSYWAGVTDNATGNAGMVECARVLNQHRDNLERDLWIAFWPAHEGGRYGGSTWFAEEFALEVVENCLAHVNFDSPGAADATEFDDMIVWMPEADDVCRTAIDDVAGKRSVEYRPRRAGDYSFNNLGVTGMLCLSSSVPEELRQERGFHPVAGSGGNSDAWHLTTNTLDKADPDVLERDIRIYLIILSRLLTSKVVPLNHRRTVARHREVISEYAATADEFDLAPVQSELTALEQTVADFYSAIDEGHLRPGQANEGIRRLSRFLVPPNFVSGERFAQDPARYRPPYPGLEPVRNLSSLAGDEYRFQRKALRRARNSVVHDLRQARRGIKALL